jgi:ribosomal protein L22
MAKGHRSQIKKERNIATQEKRPHATAKYVGIPAPKAKIVLDQIKGKDVATAAAMLNYSPRLAAEIIGKVLKSAVANAENNLGMDVSKLYVEEVSADQGPTILVPPNDSGGNIDVDLVVKELNQVQTQTLKDDLYNAVLTICGMPNRNGGTSTSDTGAAVLLRDGWSLAEARAKDSEHMFKKAEKKMLKLVLRICRDLSENINLRLKDIELQFTRRNYENIQSKSQVLVSMLQQPKIHPLLAFQHSGLFVDPERAYTLSMKYYEEQQEKLAQQQNTAQNNTDGSGNPNGSDEDE